MKNLCKVLIVMLAVGLCFAQSYAGAKNRPQTMSGNDLVVLKASHPPVIDGKLDDIWKSVDAVPMLRLEGHATDSVLSSMHEHYASFRAMWDETNFYLFVSVVDAELEGIVDRGSPWNDDCIEIFFDGGNSKGTTYDSACAQWRYDWAEQPGDTGVVGNLLLHTKTAKAVRTSTGYDLEVAIPKDSLPGRYNFLKADNEIGFEISSGDRRGSLAQNSICHWWTNNGQTWNNESLFGTALLSSKEANEVLNVYKADPGTPITIDGVMSPGEWDNADEVSMNQTEGGSPLDSLVVHWKDHLATFRALWDEKNFYVFVTVLDSALEGVVDRGSPWNDDCVEIFFDGTNSKGTTYDTACAQWRYDYPEAPGDTGVVGNLLQHTPKVARKHITAAPAGLNFTGAVNGYTLEVAIPKDSLAGRHNFLKADNEVGFEISSGDRDNTLPQHSILHWWTTNGQTWNNASLFGTILLVDQYSTAVPQRSAVVTDFRLEQNYPNPFNPTTQITFSLAKTGIVKLAVYNILGQQVAMLVNGSRNAGPQTVTFNAGTLSSGVYFYKLEAGGTVLAKKMMLLK